MNSEWQRVALDELYEFSSGLSKPRSAFGSGYPFLSFKDVFYNSAVPKQLTELVNSTSQERERCSVRRGDVFLTRTSETMDELGMSCVALKDIADATFNGFTKRLRPKHNQRIVPEFARYYFRSPEFRNGVTAMTSMSTRASLNNEMLSRLYMVLPSHAEQGQIGHVLGALDDRITLLRETNKTLESIAQAIFKSWFVDFEPVRAKIEGRQPEGMDEETAALFPDSFEESALGSVPRGWLPIRLDSFLELAYGKALKAENRNAGAIPVYGSGGVTGWHDSALCTSPSIIVGRKGTVGSLYWESRPFFPIDTVFYVKTKRPLTYCYQLLKTLGLYDMNTDAAVPGLNRENVYRLQVPDIPSAVLKAFDATANLLRQSVDHNERRVQTLSSVRDTLLPRLVSGQLRLPEAQEQVENALS